MAVQQRGVSQEHEQVTGNLLRDTRTLGQRIADFLKEPIHVASVVFLIILATWFLPFTMECNFFLVLGLFIYSRTRKIILPFRMPKRAQRPDYNTPKPGSNKPSLSNGIYFFGNDRKTDDELWFTNDDMRTHALIFGSTGSGKTEALVSIAYNALVQGSGFIYVDGKGDNSLFAKVFSLVRFMGREDDLLLINFMTGARDVIGPQERRLSNTMNPFAAGSSSMLSQLVVSLMDSGSGGGNGDMWKGRAISFVEALMKVLTYMRDAGHILIDANLIRNYFSLERLEAMVMDKEFIRDGQSSVSLANVPDVIMEPIVNYVLNLPGYNKAKKGKQVSQVYEQHGYITMQLTRVFSSLADTYGHIIRTNLPEVDLKDVVLNRRILVVLLPALEKSPDELSNLGKVIIASLKAMMASGLGDEVEGSYAEVIERKPTNARNPYLCILDEYGYYAVQGFAVVPAQARSLGFSVIFAGQDLPAFQKASKEEAASIGANTNIKVCMKLEDPMETWDFFMKSAGEAHVAVVGGFQANNTGITGGYVDAKSAQMEKRSRIDLLDLKEQREGESHIFFKSKIVRAKMFYANPKPVKELRVNQFVKVGFPEDSTLAGLQKGLLSLRRAIDKEQSPFLAVKEIEDEVSRISQFLTNTDEKYAVSRGAAALMTMFATEREVDLQAILNQQKGKVSCFMSLGEAKPLLDIAQVYSGLTAIEQSFVQRGKEAKSNSLALINDLHMATTFPVEEVNVSITTDKLVQMIDKDLEEIIR